MATLLLTAVGASIGGSFGGTVLGLSGAVIGKAVGATLGSVIDQKLLGGGADPVEVGKATSFRVQGSTEGSPIPHVAGRMRIAGQVIWSTRYIETVRESGGSGKGMASGPSVREYSYAVSCAIGLCEGEILRIGRVWADGRPFALENVQYRLYRGDESQLPDPLIEAVEGEGMAPAYRGLAYIVLENLPLGEFGNRIPQFNVEVFRQPQVPAEIVPEVSWRPSLRLRGVALTPGTGEYSLATERVSYRVGKAEFRLANVNNSSGKSDLDASLAQLRAELPACDAVSLVVSWFGDDLRCGSCRIRPAVEQSEFEAVEMPWTVSGLTRSIAPVVSRTDGRPSFGGTPSDQAVVAAIRRLRAEGRRVMFYPFILMDLPAGNGLPDPWGQASEQPAFPWRGRITLSVSPGQPGSPDKTPAAADEVTAFFGHAQPADFLPGADSVAYAGPEDWGFRRFILHYAHLCALAGGVDAFCIGSELRGLTQIRDGATSYPAVAALRALAADVRAILGPGTRIGYAADWSEYFGHRPDDGSGDVLFHLDPLWADPEIDFIGIDNYMPLSDWRDGDSHADAGHGSIYDLDYLGSNIAGGEGFDWYYASPADRAAQIRTPITDGAHGEHWVFRYKDLVSWWSQPHHDRPGGVRAAQPTPWVPQSKPIWFTEIGCPAVDKGTNQPNVFWDPKSSESFLPYFSTGARDDYIQTRYLMAHMRHWHDPANNPVSALYGGSMVDVANIYAWAWDARPWPDFPARQDVWSDGPNYTLGHWLQGRVGAAGLAEVVAEHNLRAGVTRIDVSGLHGSVPGAAVEGPHTARQAIQPLMLAFGFDGTARGDRMVYRMRGAPVDFPVGADHLALENAQTPGNGLRFTRSAPGEVPEAVRIAYLAAENDYQRAAAVAIHPGAVNQRVEAGEVPVALDAAHAQGIAERWLAELRVARDTARFALPPSLLSIEVGDLVTLPDARGAGIYRIESIEEKGVRIIEARRVERDIYRPERAAGREHPLPAVDQPAGLEVQFLDLPLLRGDEVPHAPWVAIAARPWPGPHAVYSSDTEDGYVLNRVVRRSATMGETLDPILPARPWCWSRQPGVRLRMSGPLQSRARVSVLNGANALAVRAPGSAEWEVIQFENAELIASDEYLVWGLLRGQAGTEFLAGAPIPAGAEVVVLDRALVQIDLAPDDRGLERHYRVGPASLPYSDPIYRHRVESFRGVGLRPLAPVHLRARKAADGSLVVTWIRRSRTGGDSWDGFDVPMDEDADRYRLRILTGGTVRREVETGTAEYLYTPVEQLADGAPQTIEIDVAQLSAFFGAGPSARMTIDV